MAFRRGKSQLAKVLCSGPGARCSRFVYASVHPHPQPRVQLDGLQRLEAAQPAAPVTERRAGWAGETECSIVLLAHTACCRAIPAGISVLLLLQLRPHHLGLAICLVRASPTHLALLRALAGTHLSCTLILGWMRNHCCSTRSWARGGSRCTKARTSSGLMEGSIAAGKY